MPLDIINFATKLLSKIQYFQNARVGFHFEEDSDFSSMINHHLLKCIKPYLKTM